MKDIGYLLDFLSRLARNNDREWLATHRDEYLRVMAIRDSFAEELLRLVAQTDSRASLLRPKDCCYRLCRDTRFSADKTPFKTHIGIFICPPYGKKSPYCGYYFHLEPGNCFFAAGTIGWDGRILAAVRKSIYDEIDEYRSIVESREFRSCFGFPGENPLKTAPKGFDRNWEYIGYVRPRDFVASSPGIESLYRDADISSLEPYIRQAKRFNDFLNYAVEEAIAV